MAEDPLVVFGTTTIQLNRAEIRAFAHRVQSVVAGNRPFLCLVAGDRKLQALNREFLQKDHPADVLSFPSGAPSGTLGDVAISAQRAAAQAAEFGHAVEAEISILLLHGVLHLLGHDHETDRGAMRRLESRWRKTLGLPSGLIERVSA